MSEKARNKLHDVYLLKLGEYDEPAIFHCEKCGKIASGEEAARILDEEVCTGKRSVQ